MWGVVGGVVMWCVAWRFALLALHDSHCVTCFPLPCLHCLLHLAMLALPALLAVLDLLPLLLALQAGCMQHLLALPVAPAGLALTLLFALLALHDPHCMTSFPLPSLHCLLPLSMLALLALLAVLDLLPLLLACRRTVVPTPCSCFSAPLSPDSQLAQQPETPPPQQESHSLLW